MCNVRGTCLCAKGPMRDGMGPGRCKSEHFGAYSMVWDGRRSRDPAPRPHASTVKRVLSFACYFWSITRKLPKQNTHPASSTLPHPDLAPEPLSSPTRRRQC